jgi:hypothetical protein
MNGDIERKSPAGRTGLLERKASGARGGGRLSFRVTTLRTVIRSRLSPTLAARSQHFGGRLFGTSDSFQVLGSAVEANVGDYGGTGPGVCTARWGLSFDWGLQIGTGHCVFELEHNWRVLFVCPADLQRTAWLGLGDLWLRIRSSPGRHIASAVTASPP